MSNLGNYSPYNKTFKFILFQNQAYHEKAKKNMRPVVRTNLRYKNQSSQQFKPMSVSQEHFYIGGQNPQFPKLLKNLSQNQSEQCLSPVPFASNKAKSMIMSGYDNLSPTKLQEKVYIIDKQKRIIHKHQSYQKFKNKQIVKSNKELVQRLLGTSCQVIKNKKSSDSFNNHLKYRNIRKVYHQGGTRKHPLSMGNSSLLCPTLAEFNKSGLGPKFLQKDLSFCTPRSMTASRLNSPRKSQMASSQMRRSQM